VDHLTPDVLAAWMDGALTASERAAAEAHASDCAHCQAMLAAMARITPAPAQRAWWSMPAIRWLVPIAAALGSSGLDRRRTHRRARSETGGSQARRGTDRSAVGRVKAAPPATETRLAADNAAARQCDITSESDPRVSKDEARSKGAVGGVAGASDSFARQEAYRRDFSPRRAGGGCTRGSGGRRLHRSRSPSRSLLSRLRHRRFRRRVHPCLRPRRHLPRRRRPRRPCRCRKESP
jgi:hypothetical protein